MHWLTSFVDLECNTMVTKTKQVKMEESSQEVDHGNVLMF